MIFDYPLFKSFCSVQPCLFVQCQPGIFLVQYRLNLNNVGVVFAATDYYQKINPSKIKIPEKWPDVVQTALRWTFSCVMLSIATLTIHYLRFFRCNIVSEVLRQHCSGFFPVQCLSIVAPRQHCLGFCPVQCSPKSIKTTLNRQHWTGFFWRNIVWSLKDNIT